ncbi:hypothetical protein D3C77_599160 [compost metagenome]
MGAQQLTEPGIAPACQLRQLAQLGTRPVSQALGVEKTLDLHGIRMGHAVITGDLMT